MLKKSIVENIVTLFIIKIQIKYILTSIYF